MLTGIAHWLRLRTGATGKTPRAGSCSFEPLEPRVLLSVDLADAPPTLAGETIAAGQAIHANLNEQVPQQQESAPLLTLEASSEVGTSGQPDATYSGGTDGLRAGPLDLSDTSPPTIDSVGISPTSVPLGGSFQVTYTVSDSGGSGLNSVELWRSNDQDTWQFITQNTGAMGDGPVTGYLSDIPPSEGNWWYRIQVYDADGNSTTQAPPLQVVVGPPDLTPPSPNPSQWAVMPHAGGSTSMQMAAMVATDVSGVEYYFDEISGSPGATDSDWQDSNVYEDTGLSPSTTYIYQVKTRDKSPNHNETGFSDPASAMTDPDTTPPSPDPSQWSVMPHAAGSTSMQMTAMVATDVSGVEYYFDEISGSPGATDSDWQDSNVYEDTGLSPSTTYIYQVRTRDKSPNHNETGFSDPVSAMTDPDLTPPSPNPSQWSVMPYATGADSIRMVATVATDVSGVEYYFREISDGPGATDSDWQDSNVYEDTGLSPSTTYRYQVMTRDKSPNQNQTQPAEPSSATTLADTTPPAPSPSTWAATPYATGAGSVFMVATSATDVSGVEYYFHETSGNPGATDSDWQDSNVYEDTGLSPGTVYTYVVKTRDRSVNHNEGEYSAAASVTTPGPVYRFWSPVLQRHFYTIKEGEKNKLEEKYSDVWTYEQVAYYAFAGATDPIAAPVYRFWSASLQTHFYTIRDGEKNKLINNYSNVWTYEGVAFYTYAPEAHPQGTSAVFRFWSDRLQGHFYTIRSGERDKLVNDPLHIWAYELEAWYAYPA